MPQPRGTVVVTASVPGPMTVYPLLGIPEIRGGDPLARLVHTAVVAAGLHWQAHDVVVISSKVVSKAAGLRLPAAHRDWHIGERTVAVIAERAVPSGRTQIGRSTDGTVHVAAGVDASNLGEDSDLLMLPADCTSVAASLRKDLLALGAPSPLAVIISDTVGRPWREGHSDIALGMAGIEPLEDLRQRADADGRPLVVTQRAVADELAAAADLVKGKTTGVPAALIRGATWPLTNGERPRTHRPSRTDWFALGTYEAIRSILGLRPGTLDAHQVGIPCISGMEDAVTRLTRAVRAAEYGAGQHALTQGARVTRAEGPPWLVECSAPSPTAAGALAMMVAAAAQGEGFSPHLEPAVTEGSCVVRLTDKSDAPGHTS